MSRNRRFPGAEDSGAKGFPDQARLPELPRRTAHTIAACLLFVFAGLSIWEMVGDSVTIDERVYLPAGYAYWQTGDFTLNPEHPPLVKLIAAAPLLLLDLHFFPPPTVPAPDRRGASQNGAERQMTFGNQFLYTQDADRIMFWGRLPMVGVGLLLGFFIYCWSWQLHGRRGAALLSLFLFVLEPTLIAHSHYVATDVAPACFSLIAMYFLWRFSRRASWHDLICASVSLGLALASKFSAIFLLPVFIFLLLLKWPTVPAAESRGFANNGLRVKFVALLSSMFVAGVTVQACYLFSPDLFLYPRAIGNVNFYEFAQSILPYVNGEFVRGGVWWYHFYVVALKTPLPALAAILIAGLSYLTNRRGIPDGVLFVVLPAAVFACATSALANNLGARYMIPATVFFLVLAGRSWFLFTYCRLARIAGCLLSAWLIVSVLRVSPHYIAYFNELIGGPESAPRYLDDSNIDWGQDLKRLARYLERGRVSDVVLGYWGPTPPDYYLTPAGIRHQPWTYEIARAATPPPGLYAISVNHLVGIKREQLWLKHPADPSLDWFQRFRPAARIGYSIYLYKFPRALPR